MQQKGQCEHGIPLEMRCNECHARYAVAPAAGEHRTMTLAAARAIMDRLDGYVSQQGSEVILDGWFTAEQLEALSVWLRSGGDSAQGNQE